MVDLFQHYDQLNPPEPTIDLSAVSDLANEPPFLPVPKAPFYWIAKSAMQKNIRGGRVRDAVRAAAVLWQFDKDSLKRRIAVIAIEDVGMGDWPRSLWALNTLKRGRMQWRDYVRVVVALATANKNRDTDDGFNLVIWARGTSGEAGSPPPERAFQFPDTDEFRFLVEHSSHLPLPRAPGLDLKAVWPDFLDRFSSLGPEFARFIQMVSGWCGMAGWHTCHLVVLAASRWSGGLPSPIGVRDTPFEDPPVSPGSMVTLSAFDGHTLQGKRAQSRVAKSFGITPTEAHFLSFFLEGARLDRVGAYQSDYRELVVSSMWPSGLPPYLGEYAQMLNDERSAIWAREFAPHLRARRE